MTDFATLWKAVAKKLAREVQEVDLIDNALRQAIPTLVRQRDAAIAERDALRAATTAHTDDEREVLLRTIINAPESGDSLHVAEAKRVRDAVLAAGFHRTVQGEPTLGKRLDPDFRADLVEAAYQRIRDVHVDVPEGVDDETLAQNVVAAQEFLWIARGFPAAKDPVQGEPSESVHSYAIQIHNGEPSDAQVARYLYDHEYYVPEGLRAALRAAAETGGEHRG